MLLKDGDPRTPEGFDYRGIHLDILSGDLTQVQSDALITPINSERMWFGGIDGAIMRTAGEAFHQGASDYLDEHPKATDGSTIFVDGSSVNHGGQFRHVIFVIDDLSISLQRVVEAGLEEAIERKLQKVSMPLMRSGVMAGVVERTPEEVAERIMLGIKGAADAHPDSKLSTKIVVYSDPDGQRRKTLVDSAERVLRTS